MIRFELGLSPAEYKASRGRGHSSVSVDITGPALHAENGTARTANYFVGVGSQPAEHTLNHASSNDEQIRLVFGHGPHDAID